MLNIGIHSCYHRRSARSSINNNASSLEVWPEENEGDWTYTVAALAVIGSVAIHPVDDHNHPRHAESLGQNQVRASPCTSSCVSALR
jgi:hypothetical protein